MSRQWHRSALRVLIGLQFLRVRGHTPAEQFALVWNRLRRSRLAIHLASRYGHRSELEAMEVLLMLCTGWLRRRHAGFVIPLRIENLPAELQQTQSPLGAICVSTHSGHAAAATALSGMGHPSCLLVDARPDRNNQFFHQRMQERYPDIKLIPNDHLSLVRVARELASGRSLCCAVDYQDPILKTYRYISPVLFELAKRTGRPMYFGRPGIAEDGTPTLTVDGPHHVTDALDSARHFIAFINQGRRTPRSLNIGPH